MLWLWTTHLDIFLLFSWAKEISLGVELDWKLWKTGAVPASPSLEFHHNHGLWSMQGTRSVTTSNCLVRTSAYLLVILSLIQHTYQLESALRQCQPSCFSTPSTSIRHQLSSRMSTLKLSHQPRPCRFLIKFLTFLFSAVVFRQLGPVRYQDMFRQPRRL